MKIIKILLFPFRMLYHFIRFLILDTIDDIKFMRRMSKNEGRFLRKLAHQLREISYDEVKIELKKSWLWFLIVALAFMLGFMLSSMYYGDKCREIIYENFIKDNPLYAYKYIDYDAPFENGSGFQGINVSGVS